MKAPAALLPEVRSIPERAFDSLVTQIKAVEQRTGPDDVVGAWLASFGQAVIIHVHELRLDGQMLVLEGITADGSPATLVQHYTQASVLLLKTPKAPHEEKRSIGFLA